MEGEAGEAEAEGGEVEPLAGGRGAGVRRRQAAAGLGEGQFLAAAQGALGRRQAGIAGEGLADQLVQGRGAEGGPPIGGGLGAQLHRHGAALSLAGGEIGLRRRRGRALELGADGRAAPQGRNAEHHGQAVSQDPPAPAQDQGLVGRAVLKSCAANNVHGPIPH